MAQQTHMTTVQTLVRVRVRPRLATAREQAVCLQLSSNADDAGKNQGEGSSGSSSVAFVGPDGTAGTSYEFDRVYGEHSSQADVFRDLTFVVDAALSGYNGTVLAYGQTGSGKTHTLFGSLEDEEHAGIVPRAVAHLGHGIAEHTAQHGATFRIMLSVVEIYCEKIRCLLSGGAPGKDNLQVKTDKLRGVFVEGAHEMEVFGEDDLVRVMTTALNCRSVGSTQMNEASSRSHCVVTIWVERSLPNGEAALGKLVLVDLAGSERAGKTGAAGTQLAEGSLINKSLSSLANVINALTADTSNGTAAAPASSARHVPFRDSKLTHMLRDSLGGTSRTVMICCCSPTSDNAQETLSTLRFGARAKGLTCKLQVNQRVSAERLQQLLSSERAKREALATEIDALRAALGRTTGASIDSFNTATSSSHEPGANSPAAADTPCHQHGGSRTHHHSDASVIGSSFSLSAGFGLSASAVDAVALGVIVASILLYFAAEDGILF